MSDIADFLGKVPLFSTLSQRQLNTLAKRVRERTYDEGEALITQGKNGIGLFVIVSGNTNVLRIASDGTSRVIDTKGPYDFVGELSLLEDAPRTASVVATEPVKCYVLFKLDFLDELRDEPDMAIALLTELAARFRRLVLTM